MDNHYHWVNRDLRLIEEPGGYVSHVCLFKLIILSIHAINADILEGGNNGGHVEAHSAEPVDEIFVVAMISGMS